MFTKEFLVPRVSQRLSGRSRSVNNILKFKDKGPGLKSQ